MKITAKLSDPQPKKHSIRFDEIDKNQPISSIYIKRSAGVDESWTGVKITIEKLED